MFIPLGDDSPARMFAIIPLAVRTWHVLAQVITADLCCCSQRAYIANVITGVWSSGVGICDARLCTVCVQLINPRVGQITDYSKSAKDIDPYFRSQLYVKDPGHRKSVLILPNRLSKPGV